MAKQASQGGTPSASNSIHGVLNQTFFMGWAGDRLDRLDKARTSRPARPRFSGTLQPGGCGGSVVIAGSGLLQRVAVTSPEGAGTPSGLDLSGHFPAATGRRIRGRDREMSDLGLLLRG